MVTWREGGATRMSVGRSDGWCGEEGDGMIGCVQEWCGRQE